MKGAGPFELSTAIPLKKEINFVVIFVLDFKSLMQKSVHPL